MATKLYFATNNTLKWYCLTTFELEEHNEDPDCRMFNCVQLEDDRVLISSAIKFSNGTLIQQSFLFDNGQIFIRKDPSLGILGLQMVNIGSDVFYISGQKCEKYKINQNAFESIEDLSFSHIKGGTCSFNDSVLVISGINCKEIECLGANSYWVQLHSLPFCIFDITCVQISDEEVLCVNNKKSYRINPETGNCVETEKLCVNIEVKPVKRGQFVYCLNYKNQLVRYSLKDDRWVYLCRSGCCEIF